MSHSQLIQRSSWTASGTSNLIGAESKAYELFFNETLLAHKGMIARVVSSYERSRSLQEELYQEISVALWKALAKFDHQSSLKTYILSIAHKRSVSHVARCVKEPYSIEIEGIELAGDKCPSEQLSSSQKMNKMLAAIFQLPMVERQLVTLALEGVSYKDISEILGISVSNVGAKLNRAKNKLSNLLNTKVIA